jgi:hypothetical protein
MTMVDDSKRRTRAYVAERDISRICPGELAQISAEGVGDPSEGRVDEIAPEFTESPYEPGQGRFRAVELSISMNEKRFSIGQAVAVKLLGCGA